MDETDGPASSAQNVLAVNGVAYGVIGADLHVFGGKGVPVYRLANWRTTPRPDSSRVREMPSRTPGPHSAVAGRTGRQAELEQLSRWRDSGSGLQLRWLHGAGGERTSQLADQLAVESVELGWNVVVATDGPVGVLEPGDSQDLRPGGATGYLVIIDDADRWPLSHLTWLLSNTLFHQAVPTRVLLVARTYDAWPRLRAAVACLQTGTSSQFLE
jgi:hypothetical protein